MKFYDTKNKRLILLNEKATPEFWDRHWKIEDFVRKIKSGKNHRLIKRFTKKFLKPGSKILDGGCGIGQNVYGLKYWGYDAYGVDFAKETIKKVEKEFPELNVSVQDLIKLDFPSNFFDGYWSLGVIEHFWEGYGEILNEAERVIRPEGYLYLAFPFMSPLRKLKARLGLYKIFEGKINEDEFYQFILSKEGVKLDVEEYGFQFVSKYFYDATKGIKSEISLLKPILQKIYDCQNISAKGIKFLISLLFSRISAHCILLVFQKKES